MQETEGTYGALFVIMTVRKREGGDATIHTPFSIYSLTANYTHSEMGVQPMVYSDVRRQRNS